RTMSKDAVPSWRSAVPCSRAGSGAGSASTSQAGCMWMRIETRLTSRLGIKHPIMLAPMGTAAGGALASAVTNAGGLGLVGGGYGDAAWIEQQFREAGNARVGGGFITW